MTTVRKLLHGLEKKYKVYSLLCPLTMIGEILMETAIPLMMAKIIDVGIAQKNLPYVLKTGSLMILMSLVSLIFGGLGARFGALASLGFARNLRQRLFGKIQTFSFGNIDNFSSSSLVTRLTTDVTNLQNTYQMIVRICFRAPFMLLSGVILAFHINSRLSLIFLAAIPFLGAALFFIAVTAYPRFKTMLAQYDKMNSRVQENLTAIRVVKSFVRSDYESRKFDEAAYDVRKFQVRAERIVILNNPIMQAVVYVCIILALWFGGNMIVAGNMQTGELVSFISYIGQILMSLMMLSMIFITIVLSRASTQRITEVFDEIPEIQNPSGINVIHSDGSTTKEIFKRVPNGSVEFKNVSFSYVKDEKNCVLSDVNIKIESGSVVGIIGGTGSSKSTFVSLIPRLYDTLKGTVSVGGIDVRKYDLKTLRNSVAFVLQKNVLFSGTIKENLRWGNENATEEEIVNACIASDAHEFISTLPLGYDTVLGQGGVNISGGQKQRFIKSALFW